MFLRLVLRHRWKRLVRQDWTQWLQKAGLALLGTYFAVCVVGAGFLFPLVLAEIRPAADPAALLSRFVVTGLLALLVVRFFFQPSPHTDVRPHLHLPLDRKRLARAVLGLSAFGLFNALSLCFFVPVWFSTVRPAAAGLGGALLWEAGAVALLLLTHYLVLPLRILSRRHSGRFWTGAALIAALLALDETLGPGLFAGSSVRLFGALLEGHWGALLVLLPALAGVFAGSVRLLLHALRSEKGRSSRRWMRGGGRWLARLTQTGPVGALAAVDLHLAARNSRVYGTVVMSVLAIPYVLMIADDGMGFLLGFAGLISSGGFAVFYGQHFLAWNGTHVDGLLTRAPSLAAVLRAKLYVLQGSCLLLYLLGLPFFAWVLPAFLPVHAAFVLFNAGVVCPLVALSGLFATNAIDLSESAFSNQGSSNWLQLPFSLLIFLAAFLAGMLPAPWHLWLTGSLGLLALLATPWWTRALARLFAKRRYRMLTSFRTS